MKRNFSTACTILAVFASAPAAQAASEVEFVIPVDSSVNELFVAVQPAIATYDGRKVDPVYARITKATGGHLFVMDKNSTSTSGMPIRAMLDTKVIEVISGKLDEGKTPISFKLYNPSGEELLDVQKDVESIDLNNGRLVSVKSPATGNWKVKVNGSNDVEMKALANTYIYISDAKLVQMGGRPGHQGYFKKDDQTPHAGKKEMMEISITSNSSIIKNQNNLSNLEFVFLKENGEILQHLKSMEAEDSRGEDFIGEVTIPNENYMVAMLGMDANGIAFQRNYAPLFEPKK